MNKMRRRELEKIIDGLEAVQDRESLYSIINKLEDIQDDEKYYFDNIPENLRYSQRAEDSEMAIDNMDIAINLLNKVCDEDKIDSNNELMQEAIKKVDEACW